MDVILATLIIIGLVAYALERTRRRPAQLRPRLGGSVNFADRDRERVLAELHTRH